MRRTDAIAALLLYVALLCALWVIASHSILAGIFYGPWPQLSPTRW